MPEKVIFDAVLAHGSDAAFRKEEDENGFRFTICPNTETKTESVTAYLPFEFKKDDRLFLNGYQSWTQSREYGVRDFDRSMRFCPKFLDKNLSFPHTATAVFTKKNTAKAFCTAIRMRISDAATNTFSSAALRKTRDLQE